VYENRVVFVWVDLYFSVCSQQHLKWVRAIRLLYPLFFWKIWSSSNTTNKIHRRFQQLLVTIQNQIHVHNFFLTMTNTMSSQNTDLSSWIALYRYWIDFLLWFLLR